MGIRSDHAWTSARWLFPIALLLFAGFFFGGRLGWWSDDYWHCLRDPISGAPRAWIMNHFACFR